MINKKYFDIILNKESMSDEITTSLNSLKEPT